MAYLAFAIAALLAVFLLGRAFVNADPAVLARGLRWGGVGLAVILVIFLIYTEELGPAVAVIGGLLTWLFRGHALWRLFRLGSGPSSQRTSEVETDTLRMTLDHDTGTMSGTIRRGPHQGQRLTELTQAELVALLRLCRVEDEAAAKLLETYLDRTQPGWRGAGEARGESESPRGARSSSAMTRQEAFEILGLQPGAPVSEIKAAHHRLMLKLHPDQGGSTYLAARINQAKDVLLKG